MAALAFGAGFVNAAQAAGVPFGRIGVVFDYPGVVWDLSMGAIGFAFVFPLIHLAIASLFASKRNSTTRRRIFIGWGVVAILIAILTGRA